MSDQDKTCCEEPHFYGGQAVIEGVMMRAPDRYAVAVRRMDGEVVIGESPLGDPAQKPRWLKWPLVRGCVALVDSVVLGFAALQFSADVLAREEQERRTSPVAAGEDPPHSQQAPPEPPAGAEQPAGLGRLAMALTTGLATLLSIGLFIVLPTWAVDWIIGVKPPGAGYGDSIVRNLVEGAARLAVIVLYIVAISAMKYVRRVFQYHGAEHATINCYEAGDPVVPEVCLRHTSLHPRCGTAFLLVVIVVKIILGSFFGWPSKPVRALIRILLLPIVAGIAYEVIRWAGRHRSSWLSRILAAPGMLMQILTTRRPDASQIQVAIYALAAVAPEVQLPAGWPEARRLPFKTPAPAETPAAEKP